MLYHLNSATFQAEACTRYVSCPYGDLDTEHYSSPEEVPGTLAPDSPIPRSVALMDSVNVLHTQWSEAGVYPTCGCGEELVGFSFSLGKLATGPTKEAFDYARRCLFALTLAVRDSYREGTGATRNDLNLVDDMSWLIHDWEMAALA